MRAIWLRLGATAVVGLLSSCTFGGLADYDIKTCDPGHQSQKEDECDALNDGDTTGCDPWQCNAATLHCARAIRDDDRDGNPPPTCGGTDCNDHDSFDTGRAEVCDGHDNNCNVLIDDGISYAGTMPQAVLSVSPSLGVRPDPIVVADAGGIIGTVVATTTTGSDCIDVFALDSGGSVPLGPSGAECSFLSENVTLSPVQPFARRMSGGSNGVSTTFVETSGCPVGALGYRWYTTPGSTDAGQFDMPCPQSGGMPANGAALPVIEDLGSNTAVLLFYDVSVAQRSTETTTTGCAGLAPAPLLSMTLGYGSVMPAPLVGLPSGIATAPVGTVALTNVGALAAIPVDATKAASIYLLTPVGPPVELAPLPDFKDARSLSLALGPVDSTGNTTLAVVAELGCAPQQLWIAFGSLDLSGAKPALTMLTASMVTQADAGQIAIHPTVAWQSQDKFAAGKRAEWLVSWTASPPSSVARRYDSAGAPLSDPFPLGQNIVFPYPASDGRVFAIDTKNSFQDLALECP